MDTLQKDLRYLRASLKETLSPIAHQKRLDQIVATKNISFILGWMLLGWDYLPLNIIGSIALSLSFTINWTILAHHTLHRGFDSLKDPKFHSTKFAKGFYRMLHWPDVLYPPAWCDEHNHRHHYYTNEIYDPDFVQNNSKLIHSLPKILRYPFVGFFILTWKYVYYCHNIIRCKVSSEKGIPFIYNGDFKDINIGLIMYIICYGYIPQLLFLFVILPLPYFLTGTLYRAMIFAGIGEILSNIHTFIIIAPNHTGSDLYCFNTSVKANTGEFYYRQIISCANMHTGGFINDLLHGYLNYQIEHHVFADESPYFYEKCQPLLKAYCLKHQIPYVQESVFIRLYKALQIFLGNEAMKLYTESNYGRQNIVGT